MSQFSSLDLQIWHGSRSRQYLLDKNKVNDDDDPIFLNSNIFWQKCQVLSF